MAEGKPVNSGNSEEGTHVNVILRCRPPNAQEIAERTTQVIQCNEPLREATLFQSVGGKQMSRTFRFDKVFGPESTQEKVYRTAISPIVQEVLDGFNCTIFAYGQTGTGKTFTMEGGPRGGSSDGRNLSSEAGVIPRSIREVFDALESNEVSDSSVKVSFLELYNEELTDLLSVADDRDKRLRLLEDRGGVVVQGLEELVVKSAEEIYAVLDRGTSKRRTAETLLNKRSSRSHSVFAITIHMKETTPEGEDVIKIGKLNLVDLAGSENISRSGAKDGRAREAGNINQSLLTLGRVITALVEHSGHIPYRDSKLTRLLRDSLGGKTKTCIIATIAPSVLCLEETISTLDYAHRAKNIRNRPEVNQRISKTTMIRELTTEIDRLKMDLIASREKNGVFIAPERYEQMEMERAQLRLMTERSKAEIEALALQHQEELAAVMAGHAREAAAAAHRLSAAQEELRHVTDELTDAQVALQERNFFVASYQRAEGALAGHAEEVVSELSGAACELARMVDALQAVSSSQDADRGALEAMADAARTGAARLEVALSSTLAEQEEAMCEVQRQVRAFQDRKAAELASLQHQLAELRTSVAAAQHQLQEELASGAGACAASFVRAAQQQADGCHAVADSMGTAAATMGGVLADLGASLEAQVTALHAFVERQRAVTAEGIGRARCTLAGAAESVSAMGAAVHAAERDAATSSHATAAAIDAFAADYGALMRAQQGTLLEQVAALVGTFVGQRQSALEGMVAELHTRLGAGQGRLNAALVEVEASAGACASNLQAEEAALEAHTAEVGSMIEAVASGAVGAIAGCVQAVARVGVQLQQHSADTQSQLHQRAREAAQAATAAEVAVRGVVDAATQRADALGSGAVQGGAAVLASVEGGSQADAAALSALQALAGQAGKSIADLGGRQRAGLDAVAGTVAAAAAARLAEPAPRVSPAQPPHLPEAGSVAALLCPPQDVLLEAFRAQRSHILGRGGGGRGAPNKPPPTALGEDLQQPSTGRGVHGSADGSSAVENSEPDSPPSAAERGAEHVQPARKATRGRGSRKTNSRIPAYGPGSGELADRTNMD